MANRINIAIDGPASSGKGTVARKVAESLDFSYIDSGSMYRAVALLALREGISLEDEIGLADLASTMDFEFSWSESKLQLRVGGEDVTEALRKEAIGNGASKVAVHPALRNSLLERQRNLASQGAVVMDGRDIGSVVLPNAKLKIFLDASVGERARRRTAELRSRGLIVEYDTIEAEIVARDTQDKNRKTAPLIQADDAVYIDTTGVTAEQAAEQIVGMAQQIMTNMA